MKPSLVYPGAVERVLSAVEWRNRHIVVYESLVGDVIVMEDTELLQIIEAFDTSNALSAAMHPESGNLAVCSNAKLVVYEAEELFGKPPTWRPAAPEFTDISAPSSVSWVDASHLCVASMSGEVYVLDRDRQEVVWHRSLGMTRVSGCPQTQSFLAYNPEKPSSILLLSIGDLLQGSRWPKIRVLPTGQSQIREAWFVTPQLAATKTPSATFIWDCFTSQLVVSASNENLVTMAWDSEEAESVLLSSPKSTLRVSLHGDSVSAEEVKGVQCKLNFVDTNVYVSRDRVYSWAHHSMNIYSLGEQGLKAIGAVSGPFPGSGSNVCSGAAVLIAGRSIFCDTSSPTPLEDVTRDHFIIRSLLLEHNKSAFLIRDEESNTSLRFYDGSRTTMSVLLQKHPLCLQRRLDTTNQVDIVFSDGTLASFSTETGALVEELDFALSSVASADCNSNVILAATSDKAYAIHYNSPEKVEEIPSSSSQSSRRIDHFSVSANSVCAVAFSGNAGSFLELWDLNDAPKHLGQFSLTSESVIATSWTHDSNFLAVLTSERVLVFTQLSTLRAAFVKVSESNKSQSVLSCFTTQSSVCWSADMQEVYLFNGKQLVALSLDIDDTSLSTMSEFAIDRKAVGDLKDLRLQLNKPIPIYHPVVLLLVLQSFKAGVVIEILKTLARNIKFGETSEDGRVVLLDPSLNITVFDELRDDMAVDEACDQALHAIKGRRLAGLTIAEQNRLETLVKALAVSQQLDDYATSAFVEASLSADGLQPRWWVYGWFSTTQPQLRSALKGLGSYNDSLPIWTDLQSLAEEVEQRARVEFAKNRDPTSVTLYYLALRKMNVLLTLWRISTGHPEYNKTIKLLNQDFSTTRWRSAAQKNAYALLSKHRPEYAAAFFLLSDSVVDCCKVLIGKLDNMELAIAVARLYDGDAGAGMQFLRSRYFRVGANATTQNPWLQFWGACLATTVPHMPQEALDELLRQLPSDMSIIFLFARQGGRFDDEQKQLWAQRFRDAKVGELVISTLIAPLKPVDAPSHYGEHRTNSQDEAAAGQEHAAGQQQEDQDKNLEERALPANLKPAPAQIQLEPDMSAFGF